jgi:hypothetical protein
MCLAQSTQHFTAMPFVRDINRREDVLLERICKRVGRRQLVPVEYTSAGCSCVSMLMNILRISHLSICACPLSLCHVAVTVMIMMSQSHVVWHVLSLLV